MKIAISALSAVGYGGLTYFRSLIPALAKCDRVNEYHIFVGPQSPLIGLIAQENFFFYEQPAANSTLSRFVWEQFTLPRQLKAKSIDVLFTPKNINVFLAPCKTVISIRNMEPFCYHEFKNDIKLNFVSWIKKLLSRFSIQKADRVIAVSQYVKDYVSQHFPKAIAKTLVIYNGNPVPVLPKHSSQGAYLLSASKFVTYANQLQLIKGYALACRHNDKIPDLWLAGGIHDRSYFEKVKALIQSEGLGERIKIMGLVPHDQLLGLYQGAQAFLFPSCLEACPHTLIEAMACGAAIATTTVAPMPEICQDAAIYFDPFNDRDVANKIEVLLSDGHLRDKLKIAALRRASFFNWDKTAQQLVKVFESLRP